VIECQGKQHFIPVKRFGGVVAFEKRQRQDEEKLRLSNENGVRVLYYANYKYDFPYDVIQDKNLLIERIMSE